MPCPSPGHGEPAWGYRRIQGELAGLGYQVGASDGLAPHLFLVLVAGCWPSLAWPCSRYADVPAIPLSRRYFTVAVFATVEFGEIASTTEPARIVVTVQTIADLLVLAVLLQTLTRSRPGQPR